MADDSKLWLGGRFNVSRKDIFAPDIWQEGFWTVRVYLYLVAYARFDPEPTVYKGVKVERGQILRSFRKIADDVSYRIGNRTERPSPATIKAILDKLVSLERTEQRTEQHGTLITILNYSKFQSMPKPEVNAEPNSEPNNNNKYIKKEKKSTPEKFSIPVKDQITELSAKYDAELLRMTIEALRSTRKSGKVADSIVLSQLLKWEKYPAGQVERGMKTYLEKRYATEGKDERYLLGIIRNTQEEAQEPETTGSSLLDRFYAAGGA